jgi:hypothetical protein
VIPVNVAEVTGAVFDMLRAHQALIDLNVTIEVSEEINQEASRCPWIGVYCTGVKYPPRTLGGGPGYRRQEITLVLALAATGGSGRECSEALEQLLQAALSPLLTDHSLKGTVDTLDDIEVSYPDFRQTENGVFMQTAFVYFTGLVNVTAQ